MVLDMFDFIIKGADLIDGEGGPARTADVGVQEGRIAAIGQLDGCSAKETILAEGLCLCPGFIDIHRHADLAPLNFPDSNLELAQGITTVISGNCGFSPFPYGGPHALEQKDFLEPLLGPLPQGSLWPDLSCYIDAVKARLPVNMGTLVGNGTVRVFSAGMHGGALSAAELKTMQKQISLALEQGAFGLSLGLMYVPENNFSTAELVSLCTIAGKAGVPITVHLRGEGAALISSVNEMIAIAQEAGVHLHLSHFKAAGRINWGHSWRTALKNIRKAMDTGVRITWDAYPYHAGSTSLITLLPPWVQDGGKDLLLTRLNRPDMVRRMEEELAAEQSGWDNLVCSTGWDSVMISSSTDQRLVGLTIKTIAEQWGISPVLAALRIVRQDLGNTSIVFFHMSPQDVKDIISQPETILISDALYLPGEIPHPRAYGAQARLIGTCARDEGWMSVEQAVSKCTWLPAQCFGICGRGLVREGFWADLLLFDRGKIKDRADYSSPRQLPDGIEAVWVNGRKAFEKGKVLCRNAGRYLRHGPEEKIAYADHQY